MNILIVDDEIVSRHMVAALLKPYGNTSEAVNGLEAVQAYKISRKNQTPYDVIFLDILMPEMDGKTAASQIRAIEKIHDVPAGKEVKIVMLSALDDPKNVIESYYNSGATSYIVKPVSKDKLEAEFKKLKLK